MNMPRKKSRFDYSALKLNRTVGLEIEGYMKTNPRILMEEGGVPYSQIKRDGSLRNYHWQDNGGMYGVEIVTEPLSELAPLKDVFGKIISKGWSASGRAGLHIHVDASDFTFKEKLEFVRFAKRIEDVIFLFVKNRRYNNRYCRMIPNGLVRVAGNSIYHNARNYNELVDITYQNTNTNPHDYRDARIDRYQWLNIFRSHYPTIEFRLFHPIRSAEDGGMFAYFVHNLVNTVKISTPEQLEFIAQTIEQEESVEGKARKLLDSIGVPYDIPIINQNAIASIIGKQVRDARGQLVSV
jgi:hypothetical protein